MISKRRGIHIQVKVYNRYNDNRVYIQGPLDEHRENTSTDEQMKARGRVVGGSVCTRNRNVISSWRRPLASILRTMASTTSSWKPRVEGSPPSG